MSNTPLIAIIYLYSIEYNELIMQEFGDNWTEAKIDILLKYTKAYLQIMKSRDYFKLIYFDGFAGAGYIDLNDSSRIAGSAIEVLKINKPRPFDLYYFVELDEQKASSLKDLISKEFENKKRIVHVVEDDCNSRLISMANFLKRSENKNYRALAFIDPQGMQVNYKSLEAYKNVSGVDLWLLLPTGIGTNRLLTRNGNISNSWKQKLSDHLGIDAIDIEKKFYQISPQGNLFGEPPEKKKISNAIDLIAELYRNKLSEIWEYTSEPYLLKNSTNSTMFHFLLASNNKNAVRIADDIIKKSID